MTTSFRKVVAKRAPLSRSLCGNLRRAMAKKPENTAKKPQRTDGKHGGLTPEMEASKWEPGQSGNPRGRPKGARNKLGEAFLEALHEDFNEHGAGAITRCREDSPVAYVRVLASILPKDLNVTINPLEELTDAELIERIGELRDAVDSALGGTGAAAGGTEEATRH